MAAIKPILGGLGLHHYPLFVFSRIVLRFPLATRSLHLWIFKAHTFAHNIARRGGSHRPPVLRALPCYSGHQEELGPPIPREFITVVKSRDLQMR